MSEIVDTHVWLNEDEVRLDDLDAFLHQWNALTFESEKHGHTVGHMPKGGVPQRLAYRIIGYRGERAAAHYLGRYDWVRDPDGYQKPDIGDYQVRTSSRPTLGLATNNRDKWNKPFLLVTYIDDLLHFRIYGWLDGPTAKKYRDERSHGHQEPSNLDCWRIDQNVLRPMPGSYDETQG